MPSTPPPTSATTWRARRSPDARPPQRKSTGWDRSQPALVSDAVPGVARSAGDDPETDRLLGRPVTGRVGRADHGAVVARAQCALADLPAERGAVRTRL